MNINLSRKVPERRMKLPVVPCDGTVSCLGLDGLSIWADEDRSHQTKRAVPLGHNVRLNVAVVVLASPHETAGALETLSNHVVDEAVLVPDAKFLKLSCVLPVDKKKERNENVLSSYLWQASSYCS